MDNTDMLSQYIISYTALKAVRCDALQEAAHIAPAPPGHRTPPDSRKRSDGVLRNGKIWLVNGQRPWSDSSECTAQQEHRFVPSSQSWHQSSCVLLPDYEWDDSEKDLFPNHTDLCLS